MKGIIAEIDGSKMIVIAKNGDFIRCKKLPNYNIGDEITVPRVNMTTVYKRMTAVAASFLIFAMLSSGVYAYYTPYSYVSVDINPSLELSVNRFEKVIGVHAFNEDAEKVLEATDKIKNKGIDNALEQIINTASDQGYLQHEASNSVMIVVSSSNKKEEAALSDKISKASTEALSHLSNSYEVILEKTQMENFKKAKKDNISPGRVILASEFKEVKPDIDEEQIIKMPLQQAIKQIEKKNDDAVKPDKPKTEPVNENNKQKEHFNNKVKNVKELIIEKNEELGKKLIEKNNNKEKQENGNSTFNNSGQENKNSNDEKAKPADDNKENNKQQQDNKGGKKN